MDKTTFVVYTFTVEGMHRWIDAPEKYEYLRAAHHHYFVFTIEVEVRHDDREIEIIEAAQDGKRAMEACFGCGAFSIASCEQIAKAALNALVPPDRQCTVTVLEDGIQGAKVVLTKGGETCLVT